MYEIVVTARAMKDLEQINSQDKQRIAQKLQQYTCNPKQYARKLVNSHLGSYRFRIGDYRVIFDLIDFKIVILRIGLRKEIYK